MTISKTTKKMTILILLLLYLINDLHASTNRSLHRKAKSGLVYVNRNGGGFGGGGGGFGGGGGGLGGGGGRGFGGNSNGGSRGGSGDDEDTFIPYHTAGSYPTQTHGRRSNTGSLHTISLLRLVSTMSGLVILLCFR